MGVLQAGLLNQPSAQVIDGSLKFVQSNKTYLKRTPGSAGNRRTWTYSAWIKRGDLASSERGLFSTFGSSHPTTALKFSSSHVLEFLDYQGGYICQKVTNQFFRDTSWYHIVIAIDTTLTTAEDRFKLYVNGERVTSFSTSNNISTQNQELDWNSATEHNLFMHGNEDTPYDGMGAQTYFIDGLQLGPSYFGFTDPLTGTWRPKKFRAEGTTVNDGTQWSSYMSNASGAGNLFDGSTTTAYGPDGNTQTFTPPKPIVVKNSLRIYYSSSSTSRNFEVNDNGNIIATGTGTKWVDLDFTGSLTKISGSNGWNVYAIEVDGVIMKDSTTTNLDFGTNGFYLPMDGNSPIGQDKSGNGNDWTPVNFGGSNSVEKATGALPILEGAGGAVANFGVRTDAYAQGDPNNQLSRNYSINTTATGGFSGSYPKTNLFDGAAPADGNRAEAASNDDPINITFDPPITVSSTISLWSGKSSTKYQINNSGSYTTYSDAVGSYKDISHSGSLSNIKILHGSAGQAAGISAIKIDGTQLIDSGLVLALPLARSANDVSNRINGGSTTKAVTVSGAVASSAQSNLYNGSFFFDGSNDYVNINDNSDFTVGSGPFTLEFWTYKTSSGEDFFCGSSNSSGSNSSASYAVQTGGGSPSNSLRALVGDGSSLHIVNSGMDFVLNKWVHIAFVRDGNTLRLFQDGVQVGTTSFSGTVKDSSDPFMIGRGFGANSHKNFPGYIQDFRFYKGVAKYTSNFIPASTNPDIFPDTPSGVSGGSKLTKITDGAVVFGSTGYMTTTSSDYNPGTGDFAIEGYFRFPNNSGTRRAFVNDTGTFGNNSLVIRQYNTGFEFYCGGTSVSDSGFNMAQWNHAMITRSGSTARFFVNGELRATRTTSNSISCEPTNQMTIGGFYDASTPAEFMQGLASNLRLTVGSIPTDYQTSSTTVGEMIFTPSSEPLTSTSQGATSSDVKLLCCQSPTSATTADVSSASLSTNNTVTATNFNPFNTDINTVRGQETGYPTMSPLAKNSSITLEDGNLRITQTDSHGQKKIVYSNAKIHNGGKWYVEWIMGGGGACTLGMGINGKVEFRGSDTQIGTNTYSWGYEPQGNLFHNGNQGGSFGSCAAGDVIGMTIDTSGATLTIQWHKNGVLIRNSSGTICQFTGISLDEDYVVMMSHHTPNYDTIVNFGQKPFKFPPPDGFQPLNLANIRPETVIARPDKHVGVTTYTGITQSPRTIPLPITPDFIWVKNTDTTDGHYLFDTVRGDNKNIRSDGTFTESAVGGASHGIISTIGSNSFTVKDGGSSGGNVGSTGTEDYVAWFWKAGGNKNTFNVDDVGYASASDVNMNVGALNSASYNTSAIWSDMMSGPSNSGVYTNLFDGTDGNAGGYEQPTDGNTLTFTPTGGITASSSIEIYVYQSSSTYSGSADITVNGTSIKTGAVQSALGTGAAGGYVNTGTKSLTTLTWSNPSGSNNDYRLMAIRVDGKILVDSNQTPPNVPSTAPTGCSVGTKQGFSIIKYTGPNDTNNHTVPHGLLQEPDFIITKNLDTTFNWDIYHSSLADDAYLIFTTAATRAQGFSGRPTSTVFKTEHNYSTNENQDYIAYLWHDVPGLQKFGQFSGNGNADGVFVELGFKPKILLIKNYDSTGDWIIWDGERNKFNPVDRQIWPYTSSGTYGAYDQVASSYPLDFLSNGFKMRTTDADMNSSSRNYIYAAWAEAPAVNLYGGGANAR